MDETKIQDLIELYKSDPEAFKVAKENLSAKDIESVQQFMVDKKYDLPEFGVDGYWEDETDATWGRFVEEMDKEAKAKGVETTPETVGASQETETPTDSYLQDRATSRQGDIDEANRQEGLRQEFERNRDFAKRDVKNVAQLGTDAMRLAQAWGQIKSGREATKTPLPQYNPREVSPELRLIYQQAQEQAGQGFSDAERSALSQDRLSQYANALRGVGAAGQGQASLAGVGAQRLHGDAMRGNLQDAVANAQARKSNMAMLAQTGSRLAGDKSAIHQENLQYGYLPKLQDAQKARAAGARAMASGYRNLDRLASVAPYRVANLVGDYYGNNVQRGTESLDEFNARKDPELRRARRQEYLSNLSNKFSNYKTPPKDLQLRTPSNPFIQTPYEPSSEDPFRIV